MKEAHDIDRLFQGKLADHSLEAPMEIWERIDARRSRKPAPVPFWRGPALPWAALLLLFAFATTWFFPSAEPELSGFPIPLAIEAMPVAEEIPTLPDIPATSPAPARQPLNTTVVLRELPARATAIQVPATADPNRAFMAAIRERQPFSGEAPALPAATAELLIPERQETIACVDFETRTPWRTSIDFLFAPDFAIRTLEAKDADFDRYAQYRNNTEAFRYGFSAALRLSTTAPSGFAVRSGLNISQIHEQYKHQYQEVSSVTITTQYDPAGNLIGTDTIIDYVLVRQVFNNRYMTVDIPLLVGYEFGSDRFKVSVNTGAYINMIFAQKGAFRSPYSDAALDFSGNAANSYKAFRNRLGLGLYGGLGLAFKMNESLSVLLEPNVRWYPGSFTDDGYILDQRYLVTGLFFGIRKQM